MNPPAIDHDDAIQLICDLRTLARRQFTAALNITSGVEMREAYARGGAFEVAAAIVAAAIVADAIDLDANEVDPEPVDDGWWKFSATRP